MCDVHQWAGVADWTYVDLAAGKKRNCAIKIDSKAALDLIEDDAINFFVRLKSFFELNPALLAARLIARNDGFAESVFNALKVDLNLFANLGGGIAAIACEFFQSDTALSLQADINDGDVFFNGNNASLDNGAFKGFTIAIAFVE